MELICNRNSKPYRDIINNVAILWKKTAYAKSLTTEKVIKKHLEWKYNPEFANMCFARIKGKIVGSCGYLEIPVITRMGVLKCAWGMDSLVDPNCRKEMPYIFLNVYRKGVIEFLKKDKVKLLACFPNKVVENTYLKTGWVNVDGVSRFIKIINIGKLTDLLRKNFISPEFINKYKSILLKQKKAFRGGNDRVKFVKIKNFSRKIEGIFRKNVPACSFRSLKQSAYLNWRYFKCPTKKYTVFLLKKAEQVMGYIIFRVAENDSIRLGYIVDYLVKGNDENLVNAAIIFAVAYFKKRKIDLISCIASNLVFKKLLTNNGFAANNAIKFLICMKDKSLLNLILKDKNNWIITMGDGDFETED